MISDSFAFGDDLATGAAASGGSATRHGAPSYLDDLNPPQRAAVDAIDGPVLVLAGAGTGKTRVLTTRLAHILLTRRAWPGEVLAVTFTNKAAREMRGRVAALIGGAADGLWLGTFHALAARILRRHAEHIGLKSNFTILDQDDQIRLLKQIMAAAEIDGKRWPARLLLALIQRWKDRGLTPDKVDAAEAGDFAQGQVKALYAGYQDRLATLNAVDFGDLLLHNLTLFTGHEDVLADYQRRFKYILVDEYQDTNVAQYLWLRLLARSHRNLCCVGDDDQSIYSWRGAEIGNILRFEQDFPGAKVIRLEQNYRSTGRILGAAAGLIARNRGRLGKTLWTASEDGEPVSVRGARDGEEEARLVCDDMATMRHAGQALDGIAVLVRAGFQTREFEDRLLTLGIPYRVIGGPRFYERREIRDAIAYLRVIAQPDDDLALERIINTPRRGIGKATVQTLSRLSHHARISLHAAMERLLDSDELTTRARNALARLVADFARWRGRVEALSPAELAEVVLDESGYVEMWRDDKAPDAPGRLENLEELIVAMAEFKTLGDFLEHVSLVMEAVAGSSGDMVSLMTLHGAKGLEFDVVFLPGWEEGLFPHQRALDEGGDKALEEERRLAYVGLTRARRRALISFAANRAVHNQWLSPLPSRFIDELPREHVVVAVPDVQGDGGEAVWGDEDSRLDEGAAGYTPAGTRRYWRGRRRFSAVDAAATRDTNAEVPAAGARVFHRKFGYGRVTAVDGDKLTVDFDHSGAKKVLASFIETA